MKTKIFSSENIEEAAGLLQAGQLVAIPTETVYGLAANALDEQAVRNVFEAKGRPLDNPVIVHVARAEQVAALTTHISQQAALLMNVFWPGPLTLVLPASPLVPATVTAGLPTVAIRCPDHPVTYAILAAVGVPLAAPSANRSGRPSPTCARHVLDDMEGRIAAVVDGGDCQVGVESTVLDMTVNPPCILRVGGVTRAMLVDVLGVDVGVNTGHLAKGDKPRAPGMKYRHYAPGAPLTILQGTPEAFRRWAAAQRDTVVLCSFEEVGLFENLTVLPYGHLAEPKSLMHGVFAALRQADTLHPERMVATCPEGEAYAALQDRLYRAAGFHFEVVE